MAISVHGTKNCIGDHSEVALEENSEVAIAFTRDRFFPRSPQQFLDAMSILE